MGDGNLENLKTGIDTGSDNHIVIKILSGVKDTLYSALSYVGRMIVENVTNHVLKDNQNIIHDIDRFGFWNRISQEYSNKKEVSKTEFNVAIHEVSEALKSLKTLIKNQNTCNNTEG